MIRILSLIAVISISVFYSLNTVSVQAQSLSDVTVTEPAQPKKINPYWLRTFGVVNVKMIVDKSKAARTAKKEVEKLQKKYVKQAAKMEKELEAREKQLANQRKALSEEAFLSKVKSFQKKIDSDRKSIIEKRKTLEAAYISALELIKNETLKVIAKIAAEKRLDLVLPTSQILHFKNGVEISDEVLENLNKELPKVKVKVK